MVAQAAAARWRHSGGAGAGGHDSDGNGGGGSGGGARAGNSGRWRRDEPLEHEEVRPRSLASAAAAERRTGIEPARAVPCRAQKLRAVGIRAACPWPST
jgi:hypothetical protein